MPQPSFKDALTAIVKGDEKAPDLKLLRALQAATSAALQGYKAVGHVDEDVAALIPALCKCASQHLTGPAQGSKEQSQADITSVLVDLLCMSMDLLMDGVTTSTHPSPKDLHLLLYHAVKRLLMAGQVATALQQGHKLHDTVAASPSYTGLHELQVAAGLHLLVCASELSPAQAVSLEAHQHLLAHTLQQVPQILETIRASQEARKHMESVFKCLYKTLSNVVQLPGSTNSALTAEVFTLFVQASQDIQQHTKLPQYVGRVMCDLKEGGSAGLVMGVMGASSSSSELLRPCIESVVKAVWDKQPLIVQVLASTRWQACCDHNPSLALLYTALYLHAHVSYPSAVQHIDPCLPADLLHVLSASIHRIVSAVQQQPTSPRHDLSSDDRQLAAGVLSGLQHLNKALSSVLAGGQVAESLVQGPAGGVCIRQVVTASLLPGAELAAALTRHHPDLVTELGITRPMLLKSGMSAAAAALRLITSKLLCSSTQDTWPTCSDVELAVSSCSQLVSAYTADDDLGDLQWTSAFTAALGKELGCQDGLDQETAHLVQVAWQACQRRVELLLVQGAGMSADEVATMERRARACVSGLVKADRHQQAAGIAVDGVLLLCKVGAVGVRQASKLIQMHVAAREHLQQQARCATSQHHHRQQQSKPRGRAGAKAGKAQRAEADAAQPGVPQLLTHSLITAAAMHAPGCATHQGAAETPDHSLLWHMLDVVAYEEGLRYEKAAGCTEDAAQQAWLEAAVSELSACVEEATQPWAGLHARAGLLASLLPHHGPKSDVQARTAQLTAGAATLQQVCSGEQLACAEVGPAVADAHYDQIRVLHCSAACVMLSMLALEEAAPASTAQVNKRQRSGDGDTAVVRALEQWSQLTQLLTEGDQPVEMMCAPKPEVCLQLALQLWQLCCVQDLHDGMAVIESAAAALLTCTCHGRPARSLASLLALMRPGMSCLDAALHPCPATTLAEHVAVVEHCPVEVRQLLDQLAHARSHSASCCSSTTAADFILAAATTARQVQSNEHGHLWLLQQVHVLHMSASTQLQWGNSDLAWADAQQALRLASALFTCLFQQPDTGDVTDVSSVTQSDPADVSADQNEGPDDVGNASRGPRGSQYTWLCCSAYMCSLLHAARVDEVVGHVEEALSLLQECIQLAEGSGAAGTAVLAMQRAADIMIGQGKLADAQAMMARADAALTESGDASPSSHHHFLAASASKLHAQLDWATAAATTSATLPSQQSYSAAKSHYTACVERLRQIDADWPSSAQSALLACTAHMGSAELCIRWGHVAEASQHLAEAEGALQAAVQCCVDDSMQTDDMCDAKVVDQHVMTQHSGGHQAGLKQQGFSSVPWPALHAQLLLLQDAVYEATAATGQRADTRRSGSQAGIQVLGLQSTSAEVDDVDALQDQLANGLKISNKQRSAGASKGARKAAARGAAKQTAAGASVADTVPPGLAARVFTLLRCFLLSSSQPRVCQQVCEVLMRCTAQLGLLHAPCMFNSLAMGAQATSQLAAATAHTLVNGIEASGVSTAPPDQAVDGSDAVEQQQPPIKHAQMRTWLSSGVTCVHNVLTQQPSSKAAACSHHNLPALESAAAKWLRAALSCLPQGCCVTSISSSPAAGSCHPIACASSGQFMICRLSPDATPLVLIITTQSDASPEPCHDDLSGSTASASGSEARASRVAGAQTTTASRSRASQAAPSKASSRKAAAAVSRPETEPATAEASTQHAQHSGLDAAAGLLQQLDQVLQDSSASMSSAASLTTTEAKASWWKARLSLDTRMCELLADMQGKWVGPWGCLMLLQAHSSTRQAVWPAACALGEKHFSHVSSATAHSVLCEALALLLSCGHHLDGQQVQVAVSQLCAAVGKDMSEQEVQLLCASIASAGAANRADRNTDSAAVQKRFVEETASVTGSSTAVRMQQFEMSDSVAAAADEMDLECDLETSRRDAVTAVCVSPSGIDAGGVTSSCTSGANRVLVAAMPGAASKVTRGKGSRLKALTADAPAPALGRSKAAVGQSSKPEASAPPAAARSTRAARQVASEAASMVTGPAAARTARPTRAAPKPAPKAASKVVQVPVEVHSTGSTASEPALAVSRAGDTQEQSGPQPAVCVGPEPAGAAPPLLLALSSSLHALPWESMPCMRSSGVQVYRTPGLLFAAAVASSLAVSTRSSTRPTPGHDAEAVNQSVSHPSRPSPSQTAAGSHRPSRQRPKAVSKSQHEGSSIPGSSACVLSAAGADQGPLLVDLSCTWYLINPGGDLHDTQACFERWFCEELRWKGSAGSSPGPKQLLAALQSHALFVYLGHGSGEQYLPTSAMHRLTSCAANLLMGCSSGRLRQHGAYGPAGAVLSYLAAGCPAVVANLWDVTDKDIDRFSTTVLKSWLQEGPPAGRQGAQHAGTAHSMSGAVGNSRSVCKLPHLIGAAPVCYGLPTLVSRSAHAGRLTHLGVQSSY